MSDLTPMVRQYQEIKRSYKDAILFFRLGDFYEMFNEDAELVARELDLTLTGRGKNENRMPMCGVPYHAAESYIAKLIEKGYKVAICEQVEDPATAKGVVKREVIRVITSGTVTELSMLSEKTNNYLMALTKEKDKWGMAFTDITTGEFRVADFDTKEKVIEEILKISPSEIIVSDMIEDFALPLSISCSAFKDIYDPQTAEEKLREHFKVNSLESFGLEGMLAAKEAAAAILDYLQETQKTRVDHLHVLKPYRSDEFVSIDAVTRRNLELVQTVRDKSFEGSLLWVLDQTKTPMGARLLRQWLLRPLRDKIAIEQRLEAVGELFDNTLLREELRGKLKTVFDIERLASRIAIRQANARDLVALKESLRQLPKILEKIKACQSHYFSELSFKISTASFLPEIVELISKAISDNPPHLLAEGGIIRPGYHQELDELKKVAAGGKQWIAELEAAERKRTGIKSLKVGFTKVFGYYIEVTKANLDQVPPDYIRKQTLVNAERFVTPELKEKEALILNADEKIKELEYQIFCEVRDRISVHTKELQEIAGVIAQIDVLVSLAEVAAKNRYSRPQISDLPTIKIRGGRHPVVEKTLKEFEFVPNDTDLDEKRFFLLITGPNMGGKSTYMRQVALICLLAQMGSFVPAREAEVGLIDAIYSRIGAMDDIYSGQSTFMVEMTEVANILNNATDKSLIILDEIGRGTATFDGMSIAAAVTEYIYQNIKAKTLFATHYHEITQLAEKYPGIVNMNVLVKEEGDHITFLHKVVEGKANKSYGIQVARLAGLPEKVITRAKEVYSTLEMVENDLSKAKKRKVAAKKKSEPQQQASLF